MVHSLRKYLSNRGSALFMVLSTMTALMITCMAMYFAVVSSRSAGFAVFNQQQSYQSAISIAEMTVADLSAILSNSGVDINSVEVGKTFLTTDGNGFKTLNPGASNADDHYLGAYDVTMTRLANEKIGNEEYFTVDIAVTTSVSGVKEVYHQVVNIIQENGTPDRKGKIFASTGYVPNDSFLSKGSFFSDIYISNEDVIIGAYDGAGVKFYSNIFCENNFTILDKVSLKYNENDGEGGNSKPIVHAIRGDYTIGGIEGNLVEYPGGSYIFVGKDMHISKGLKKGNGNGPIEVYVLGDLYLESGAGNMNGSNERFYVAGNVYLNTNVSDAIPGVLYCGNFYEIDRQKNIRPTSATFKHSINWNTDNKVGTMTLSFDEAKKILEEKTPDIKYKLWKLDENKLKDAIGTVDENGVVSETEGNWKEIVFKNLNTRERNSQYYEPVEITYGSPEDGMGCIIRDIRIDSDCGGNVVGTMPTIIIDTLDDPSNTYTIRLQNNNVSDDGKAYFSWSPKKWMVERDSNWNIITDENGKEKGKLGDLTGMPVQILVKGNGSVVFDVPEGVVYQSTTSEQILHYNFYLLEDINQGKKYYDDSKYYYTSKEGLKAQNLDDYVHAHCDENCGCKNKYTIKKLTEQCVYCGSEVTYSVSCSMHGDYTICPKCDSEFFDSQGKLVKDNVVGLCKDRVEIVNCRGKLQGRADVNVDKEGNPIIPHCNIYLVSCSESAEFRFGKNIDESKDTKYNTFAGFIYAPYMSYRANASDGGNFLMHMGGMVVSDYNFLSKNSFIACWPSVYPPENVLDQDSLTSTLNPVSEKRYRVTLKAAY